MPHRHGHSRSPRLPLLSFPVIYEPGCYSTDRWVSTKHIAQNVWLWTPPQGLIVAAYKRSTRMKRRTAGVCQTQEPQPAHFLDPPLPRSEEHTSELQSLMRISYAVFCLKKKPNNIIYTQ